MKTHTSSFEFTFSLIGLKMQEKRKSYFCIKLSTKKLHYEVLPQKVENFCARDPKVASSTLSDVKLVNRMLSTKETLPTFSKVGIGESVNVWAHPGNFRKGELRKNYQRQKSNYLHKTAFSTEIFFQHN